MSTLLYTKRGLRKQSESGGRLGKSEGSTSSERTKIRRRKRQKTGGVRETWKARRKRDGIEMENTN